MACFGLLRIKNEARWIARVVKALQPLCAEILILDDHSTDGTQDICRKLGCVVFDSPFDDFHEARDKEYLLGKVWDYGAQLGDSCIMVDGDEEILSKDILALSRIIDEGTVNCGTFKVLYLWNDEHTIRVDRWYQEVRRASYFRLIIHDLTFMRTDFGGNMHCSSAPQQLLNMIVHLPVHVLHYGYMLKEDRIRKFHWYNSIDPNNAFEDEYRHMVIGDVFPADSKCKWAGPLKVASL